VATIAQQVAEEAYASAPVDNWIVQVLQLDTPALPTPLYFASGIEDDSSFKDENGVNISVIACGFELTPPGFDDSGPTAASLKLDGVAVQLYPILQQVAPGGAIQVTYRAYQGSDHNTVIDLIEGLEFKKVTLSATSAEGELSFAEIATQAFPRRTYDLDSYPGLWNS
jgi:hypothetical protein